MFFICDNQPVLLIFSSLVCFCCFCLLVCLLVYVRGSLGTPGMQNIPPGVMEWEYQAVFTEASLFGCLVCHLVFSVLKEISLQVDQESFWNVPFLQR